MRDGFTRTEITVGGFVLAGLALIGYLSVSLGDFNPLPKDRVTLHARFASVGDLDKGSPVKIAGVTIGRVGDIRLVDYVAEVELRVDAAIEVPADSIASIRTTGLLGQSYVSLSPGGSAESLGEGGRIAQTEPAIDLASLLQKYVFESPTEAGDGAPEENRFEDPLE